jgi:hypothetical protein
MAVGRRLGALIVGGTMLLAVPVVGQERQAVCPSIVDSAATGFASGVVPTRCSEPSMPPAFVVPFHSSEPSPSAASAAEPALTADIHLASTELGFERGVGPAPGHSVRYNGQKYRVTGIEVQGGGRYFSGGSAFVVGVAGSTLIVGLKSIVPGGALDPDRFAPPTVN